MAEDIKFVEVNKKVMAFKHPAVFDEELSERIVEIFKSSALYGSPYLSYEELTEHYSKVKGKREKSKDREYRKFLEVSNWQKRNPDDIDIEKKILDESNKILKEHLRILNAADYIKGVNVVYIEDNELKETKKYFLDQINSNLLHQAQEYSRKEIVNFILSSVENAKYPFHKLILAESIFENIQQHFFEANHLLNRMILEHSIIKVPLLKIESGKEVFKEYLIPGQIFKDEVDRFINRNLLTALEKRFGAIKDAVRPFLDRHQFKMLSTEINSENLQRVYLFCFIILEAKNDGADVHIDDYNLAQLILNSWLALEDDPLVAMKEFPELELGKDFLSPFLSRYVQNFGHITEYLKLIKGFLGHLPQIIDRDDLMTFFKTKGVQKKVVESFVNHLPEEIIGIKTEGRQYIVAKNQIINALNYLYFENFYKTTETGRQHFEILSESFSTLEDSSKDFNDFVFQLKTTPDELNRVKELLTKVGLYRKQKESQKRDKPVEGAVDTPDSNQTDNKLKSSTPQPSMSKFYTPKDFENLDDEDREKLFAALNLMEIECRDHKDKKYVLYIKKGDLNLEEAKFLRSNPSLELIKKRFNLQI